VTELKCILFGIWNGHEKLHNVFGILNQKLLIGSYWPWIKRIFVLKFCFQSKIFYSQWRSKQGEGKLGHAPRGASARFDSHLKTRFKQQFRLKYA